MNVLANLSKVGHQALFFAQKHKATIELVAGAGLVVAGTAILIHDANDIAIVNNDVAYDREMKKEIEKIIRENHDTPEATDWKDQTGKTKTKWMIDNAVRHTINYGKAAGKGVVCVTGGLVLIGMSHADLTKQLQTVSAMAAAQAMSFSEYRKRVVEDQGADKDIQYLTGGVVKTTEVKEDGTVVEITRPINPDQKIYLNSFFIENSDLYIGIPSQDLKWLTTGLNTVNHILHAKGVLTGNEIRKCFGMKETVAGQASGAFAQNKDGSMNFISIGLESTDEATQRFLQGTESNFLVRLKYSDGRPLETNIFADSRIHELGWEEY